MEKQLLELLYNRSKGIFLQSFSKPFKNGYILDLNALPTYPIDFKEVFIKWMVKINAGRIEKGLEPIMTLDIALKCPLWKAISPPIRRVKLTKEGMFNVPSIKTINKKAKPGSINRKST